MNSTDPQGSIGDGLVPDTSRSLQKLLFSFEGRIGRKTWWLWGVGAMLGMGVLLTVLLEIGGMGKAASSGLVNVVLLWPTLALSAKRWHDRDKSAWWLLINLVPLVGWIWALVENGLLPGTPGPNRFGPDPLAAERW